MIGWYPPRPPTYHHPNGRPTTIYSPEALESITPPPPTLPLPPDRIVSTKGAGETKAWAVVVVVKPPHKRRRVGPTGAQNFS